MKSITLYIFFMAITVAAVRILPLTLIRKEINNKFIKSFLYYLPYITLSVMTFPAIIDSTLTPISGVCALLVGTYFAYKEKGLFFVTIAVCLTVLVLEFILI